ncbi:hypothetical protein TMatcc_003783 [Talaromyces marneffei ATCC 18224]
MKRRGPFSVSQRAILIENWNEVFLEPIDRFVMPPSQFCPFGEFVLRTGRVHFSFELDDIVL